MKKIAITNVDECMSCMACSTACSDAFYKSIEEDLACIRPGFNKKGAFKVIACTQCGKCAKECPEEAISQNKKGVYIVDKKKCVGCGKCVEVCPFGVMVQKPNHTASKCIVCGKCVKACPAEILYIKEDEE